MSGGFGVRSCGRGGCTGAGMPPEKGRPLMLEDFPRAVLHVDADAFFASVEQAVNPALKGRPVVTGKERGIIACASYEAKALGIRRGVPLWEARRRCPQLVVLPSDYETYSLYSRRMFGIMRSFTPLVEEYSVDEGFADITGLRRVYRCSYREIACRLQEKIRAELGIGVSVGLSLSKSLAKLASKYRKPKGMTAVSGYALHLFLRRIELGEVWGFGENTVNLLRGYGLETAWDFVSRPRWWAGRLLGKTGREIWDELRGKSVWPVEAEARRVRASVSKCKTFVPPSGDRDFVYAKLVRNLESAFIKLRRHGLRAGRIGIWLRRGDFFQEGRQAVLSRATAVAGEVLPEVRRLFDDLFQAGEEYRAVMVVLEMLEADGPRQYELFEDRPRIERARRVAAAVDGINRRYGKHTVSAGTCLFMEGRGGGEREELPWRKKALLPGESFRRRVALPRWNLRMDGGSLQRAGGGGRR